MLSVCIITKNEEKNIARCLECLSPYDFEIIVADTGSSDRTRNIARQYTNHVYDFIWCDDFAAARNFTISKATNPYVMILDSDEFLENIDIQKLERQIREQPDAVGRICIRNVLTRNGIHQVNTEWINRIFLKEKYHYEGRIHEQVTALDGRGYVTYQAPVVIEHTGYDLPEVERKKKAERNISLLKRELEYLESETPETRKEDGRLFDNSDYNEKFSYILYQLGKSYYMAQDYVTACDYFSQGLSFDLNPKLEYVIDMVETYGYALINSGQAEAALFFENIYEEFGNSADFQFLMGLIYMNNARFEEAVAEFLKAVKHKECRNQGTNSYAAYYNIGVIYECLGDGDKAREFYQKCGEYEPAKKRLRL